jgi:hypothetical protein
LAGNPSGTGVRCHVQVTTEDELRLRKELLKGLKSLKVGGTGVPEVRELKLENA